MAIEQIPEPTKDEANIDDWYKILRRTTFQGGGFSKIMLTELNTSNIPAVMKGSRVEVNNSFYVVTADETINDPGNLANEQWIFVYAVVQQDGVRFDYHNRRPEWDTAKCGWFDTVNLTDRCIAKMYKRSDGWWGKVLLADYEDLYKDNFSVLPTSGGTRILTGIMSPSLNTDNPPTTLTPGAYRYELRGGTGGRGGLQNRNGTPGNGASGQSLTGQFALDRKVGARALVGGDGEDGGNGGTSSGGGDSEEGGGGGASGAASYIWIEGKLIIAEGGSGGGGCGADGTGSLGGGGGGGGGGYGIGGDGSSEDGEGGKGGNNFIGGVGGKGGYNQTNSHPGGDGTSGRSNAILPNSTFRHGGHGGSNAYGTNIGAGGSKTKTSTSGYARIYRLWESIKRDANYVI